MNTKKKGIAMPLLLATVALMIATIVTGCSNGTDSASNGSTVQMQSQFASSSVTPSSTPHLGARVQDGGGLLVDSLEITGAKIFIKDVKLHSEGNDSLDDDHDAELKLGPFVANFDSSGLQLLSSTVIPAGTYDRIKLEIHKHIEGQDDDGDLDKDDSSALFKSPDPYTVVLTGYVWNNGVRSSFTYYSKVTANITWKFPQNIVLTNNSTTSIIMMLDPVYLFKVLGEVLDPRDPVNRPAIDNSIKAVLHFENKI